MNSIVADPSAARAAFDRTPLSSRYELLEEIGRGGMGVVFRGRHRLLGQLVAIKFHQLSEWVNRFKREAQILASIRSPYVVSVQDFDILPTGQAMLVMNWIAGSDLGRILRCNPGTIPEGRAVTWMRQVCEGMRITAEQGIVHRDLKPSNILVDEEDRAYVADFGLARFTRGDLLTLTGGVLGTPHYMAPEQAEDPHSVDTRADIYSFGATFYHALTGKPPFNGETVFSILYKHKTETLISPRARRPGLSEQTSDLLERCMAKAPVDRIPSFSEVLRYLRPTPDASRPWIMSEDQLLLPFLDRFKSRKTFYLTDKQAEGELDTYTFPRGQTLRILRGDIVEERVDVLVSSDTSDIGMEAGVSAAIRRAGGARNRGTGRASETSHPRAGRGYYRGEPCGPPRFSRHHRRLC